MLHEQIRDFSLRFMWKTNVAIAPASKGDFVGMKQPENLSVIR